MFYLSRAFVEFGPFPTAEILAFYQRGLLKETDYLRGDATEDWVHLNDWMAAQTVPETAAPAPKATKKAAAPKAEAPVEEAPPPAKKPAAKKAKKAA